MNNASLPDNAYDAKRKAQELAAALVDHIIEAEAEIKALVTHHNQLAAERHRQADRGKRPGYLSASRLLATAASERGLPRDIGRALADASFYVNSPKRAEKRQESRQRTWLTVKKDQRILEERGQLAQSATRPDSWLIRAFAGKHEGKNRYLNEVVYGNQLEAEKALRELLAKAEAKRPPTGLEALTFAEYVHERYLPDVEAELNERTLKGYKYDLENRLIPTIGNRRLGNIAKRTLSQLEKQLVRTGVAPSVAAATIATAYRVLRHAVANGLKAPALLIHQKHQ